jgi:hypothetical protein
MIKFINGDGEETEVIDLPLIKDKLAAHDEGFWNGATGQSAFEYAAGDGLRLLYITVVPPDSYWILFRFPDRSTMSPRDPGRGVEPRSVYIGGEEMEVPEDFLVDAAQASRIVEQFVQTGAADRRTTWDRF